LRLIEALKPADWITLR